MVNRGGAKSCRGRRAIGTDLCDMVTDLRRGFDDGAGVSNALSEPRRGLPRSKLEIVSGAATLAGPFDTPSARADTSPAYSPEPFPGVMPHTPRDQGPN